MRSTKLGIALFAALGLPGCAALKHNDVLIFGTDTKLALDISTSATSGGAPELTIGYKRQEAVWMPLVVNGRGVSTKVTEMACKDKDGKPAPCSENLEELKYTGTAERDAQKGRDAYSVFASFGANIKGDAKNTSATVGLAQFFATGVAAQRLAANSQVANVLALQPEATGKAIAEAAAPLTDEQILARAERIKAGAKQQDLADRAAACVTLSSKGGADIASKLPTPVDTTLAARITKAKTPAEFRLIIDEFDDGKLESAVKATCP